MKKCKTCHGNKTITGMGNMREKCKACDGKGFISDVEPLKVKGKEKKEKEKINA